MPEKSLSIKQFGNSMEAHGYVKCLTCGVWVRPTELDWDGHTDEQCERWTNQLENDTKLNGQSSTSNTPVSTKP